MSLFQRLAADAKRMSRDEFANAHPNAFLLHSKESETADDWEGNTETTPVSLAEINAGLIRSLPSAASWEAFAIASDGTKRTISIGRDASNDIELKAEGVSKTHAHLLVDESGTYRISDADSSNGTWVNGEKLEPGQSKPVAPGDTITVGKLLVLFFGAADTYDHIKEIG